MDLGRKCQEFVAAKEAMARGIYPYCRKVDSHSGTTVTVAGKQAIMIGSNDYLGLAHHPHVIEAGRQALEKYGSSCTGSRLLNGTLDLHEELEARLARFMRGEATLLFPSGYQAQLGTIAALAGRNDVVYCDRQNHASILDAGRLAFADVKKYRHADVSHLRLLLARGGSGCGRLIVTDGLFSMLGDLAPLADIVEVAREYGAAVLVDDAHGIGVLGESGRGAMEHFGLEGQIDLITGSFSKAFASMGGFVVGDQDVIHYLKHHARAFIYSVGMSPPSVATALASLDIMEQEPARRTRLRQVTRYVKGRFDELGFNTGDTSTPIIPVIVGERLKALFFCRALLDQGVFANPVVSPAVASGMDLIRTSFMATHTDEQLDTVVDAFHKVGKALGVI